MKPIVCATRGGEACRRTQERAIDLAKEQNAELIFLYVADPDFVGILDESLAEALKGEMARLGRVLLRVAQGRAQEHGLTAKAAVLHGPVQQSIMDYLNQAGAGTLVVGTPRTGTAPHAFTSQGIQDFAAAVRKQTDVEVVIVT